MVIFEERQKFNQWWLYAILFVTMAVTLVAMYPLLGTAEAWPAYLSVGTLIAVLVGFTSTSLVTTVTDDAISVGFTPFGTRRIARHEIATATVTTYAPIGDYGGWGYRVSRKGKAYNMMGKEGLQLALRSGERILIGTQQAEQLTAAVEQFLHNGQTSENEVLDELLELRQRVKRFR